MPWVQPELCGVTMTLGPTTLNVVSTGLCVGADDDAVVGLVRGRPRRAVMPMLLALSAAAAIAAAPVGAAPVDGRELYFSAGYERQVDSRTCTAAATAMMMNFIARRDLNLNQMSILRFEQSRDALNNAVQRGSDPLGWSRAATVFSA